MTLLIKYSIIKEGVADMNKKILMLENQKNYLRIIGETTNKLLDNVELLHAKNTSEGIVIAMEALINVFILFMFIIYH